MATLVPPCCQPFTTWSNPVKSIIITLLQHCYHPNTLQLPTFCHSFTTCGATLLPPSYHPITNLLLLCSNTVATMLPHCCQPLITMLPHCCLPFYCHPVSTLLSHFPHPAFNLLPPCYQLLFYKTINSLIVMRIIMQRLKNNMQIAINQIRSLCRFLLVLDTLWFLSIY